MVEETVTGTAAASTRESLGPALVLAAAAVVAAVLGTRAAVLAGDASGAWQHAVREEVKAAATAVEDIRYVYGDEAPLAYRVAEGRIRVEEYTAAANQSNGILKSLLEAEATAQQNIVDVLVDSSSIAGDPKYAIRGGGFDISRRLADVRQENPDLVAIDPEQSQAEGDRLSRHAELTTAATVPVALTFLLGALARVTHRRRRPLVVAAAALVVVGALAGVAIELTA